MKNWLAATFIVGTTACMGPSRIEDLADVSATMQAIPDVVPADGVSQSAISVTLSVTGPAIPDDLHVTLFSDAADADLQQPLASSNNQGTYVGLLKSSTVGTQTLTARLDWSGGTMALPVQAPVTFYDPNDEILNIPSAAMTSLTATPNHLVADGVSTSALTVVVRNYRGDVLTGRPVEINTSGSYNTLTPSQGVSDSNGVFVSAFQSTKAETKNVTATASSIDFTLSVSNTTQVAFNPGPLSTTNTSVSSGPSNGNAVANGNFPVLVTVVAEDDNGNPIPGQTVTVSGGTGLSFTSVTGVTDANGVFTTVATSTVAGTQSITANVGGGAVVTTTPVTFTAGPPLVANCSFTAAPASIIADGISTTTLTVVLRDAYSNALTNASVTFSASGSNNVFSPASGTTDNTGTFVATLASTKAEAKMLLASAGGVFLPGSVTFVPGPPSSVTTTTVASTGAAVADGSTQDSVVVTVLDVYGNPISGQAVTFSANGTNVTLSPTSGVTDANGQIVTEVSSPVVQSITVSADVNGSFTQTATINFVPGPPSTNTTLVSNPTTVTADGSSSSTLTVTVLDAEGHPIPNANVTWASSGTASNLAPTSSTTNASGVVTATLASTKAEIKTVTATVGTINASAAVTFVAGTASSISSTLQITPGIVTANGTSTATMTVTVEDTQGNPVSGQLVSLSISGSNNTVSPSASGATSTNGTFVSTLASSKAEAKTVTATVGSFQLTQSVSFVAGPATNVTSTMSASPNNVTANGAATTTVAVTVQDAAGNPVNGQAVSLVSTGTGNTFSSTAGNTTSAGTFTATLSSTVAESKSITATVGSFNLTTNVTFVTGPPSTLTSSLSANPTSGVVADGTSTSALTVTVKDATGNLVANQAVSLSSTGINNTFGPSSGNTNASGVFTATLASTTAQPKTITATVGPVNLTATVTFVAGAPSGTTTTFVANPTSLTADGTSASTLTLTVVDAHGNPVPSEPVSLVASGGNTTVSPLTGSTNGSGIFTATVRSTTAQTESITATAGSVVLPVSVSFVAGTPSNTSSSFVVSPNTVVANGSSAMTLTFTVQDAHGNPVLGQAVTFSASGSNNNFSALTGSTNSAGVFSATLTSTTAQSETLTAKTAGSVNATANVVFTVGPPAASNTTVVANPTTVVANDANTTTLTVTVKDAFGNPVVNQAVSLSSSGSNNTFTPPAGATDSSGQFTSTMVSSTAEPKTVTATAGSMQATTPVTFIAGPASAITTTFVASPNTVAADGSSTSTLTTTVLDANHNPIVGQNVVLSVTGTQTTLNPNSGTTNASGVMTSTLTSTLDENVVVTSTMGPIVLNANVAFTLPTISSGNSNITASPNSLLANGVATTTISVTVRDNSGTAVPGQTVDFSSTGTNNAFSQLSAVTDGSGNASVTLTSTKAEIKTVTALVDGTALNTNVTFVAGSPNSALSTLTASPNSVTADGVTTSMLTVRVFDTFGNPVPTQSVALSGTGTHNTFTPSAGTTDATGTFTATLASTLAQSENIIATIASSFTEQTAVSFAAGGASAVNTTFTVNPNTLTANGTSTTLLTLTVEDAQGNPVAGQSVSLTGSGVNNQFTPVSGSTNSSGVFTATLSSTTAQAEIITGTAGAVNKTAAVTFTAGPPAAATSSLTVNPNSLLANGAATTAVTFKVEDAQGNPLTNYPVSIASNGTNNTWGANSNVGVTNGSGVFATTLASTTAQLKTLTGTAGTMNASAAVTFVAGAAASGNTTLVASPTTVTANGSNTATLTVTVDDAFGNPVTGQAVTFSVNGVSNTLAPLTGTTNGGVFAATLSSTVAQTNTVTVSLAGYQLTANVTFVAGPPSNTNTTFVASPNSLTADGTSVSSLTVTVKDAQGNPVIGQTVSLATGGSNNVFTPASPTGPTNSSGVFTATVSSVTAQTESMVATIGSFNQNQTITFVPGAPSSSTSTVAGSPSIVTANGTNTSTITVTVLDAHNNPISGQSVSLLIGGSNNTTGALSGTTNSAGQWSTTLSSTKAENKALSATVGTMNVTGNVSFVPGSPAVGTCSLSASPTSLMVSSGSATTTLTVTVLDAQGNPISGQAVSLAGGGSNNAFTPASGAGSTDSTGVFTATLSSTKAQAETITATIGSINETAQVTFTPAAPSSSVSTISVSPTSVPANGSTPTTITVTAEDAFGNLLGNAAVALNANGTTNSFAAANGNTNGSGVYTTTLTNTTSQTETITATIGGGASVSTTMIFSPTNPNLAQCTYVASPNTNVTANGSNASTLTITVKDSSGNPISGQAVTFTSTGINNTLSPATGSTNAAGQFSTTIASTTAQTDVTTVQFAGLSMNANVIFVAGPAAKLVFTTSPGNTSSFGACPLSPNAVVSVTDANGNLVTTSTNTITLGIGTNPSGATLGGTTSVIASAGVATFTGITLSKASTGYTLTAAATGLTTGTSTAFNNNTTACSAQTGTTSVGVTSITGIASGDFNGDGNLDVVVWARSSKVIKVLYGNGTGSFGTASYSITATAVFYNVVAADFNGDGWADIAMTDSSQASNAGVVYLNNKSASPFTTATAVGLGANANTITVVDVNLDGHPDLVAGGPSNATWVINSGTGSFASPGSFAVGSAVWFPWVTGTGANPNCGYINGTSPSSYTSNQRAYSGSHQSAQIPSIVNATTVLKGTYFTASGSSAEQIYVLCYASGMNSGIGWYGKSTPNHNYYGLDSNMSSVSTDTAVLVANNTGFEIDLVSTGCGQGSQTAYTTGHTTMWLTTGDFNNDGIRDVATANSDDNSVTCVLMP